MVVSVKLDNCTFLSDNPSATTFRMEKPSRYPTIDTEIFEAKVYADILTLLANKRIQIEKRTPRTDAVVFDYCIEKGTFSDLLDLQPKFAKLLSIEPTLFSAFIRSAQAFNDSLAIYAQMYSTAFSLLIYSIESLANTVYVSPKKKSRRTVKFFIENVDTNLFEKCEIRQLDFKGTKGNEQLLFRKLLKRSYILRCNYVHDAEIIPLLSQTADRLSMAFVSNDQKTLFPAYSWLRRVTNLALNSFLAKQPSVGSNHINSFTEPFMVKYFRARKAIQKGEFVDENNIYLQQLDDEFIEQEYLHK